MGENVTPNGCDDFFLSGSLKKIKNRDEEFSVQAPILSSRFCSDVRPDGLFDPHCPGARVKIIEFESLLSDSLLVDHLALDRPNGFLPFLVSLLSRNK